MRLERIILASSSPRRIDIFRNHGFEPEVIPAQVDETLPPGIKATDAVMFLALKKALHVEKEILTFLQGDDRTSPAGCRSTLTVEATPDIPTLIIAADTVVAYNDHILGKPTNQKEAFDMLAELRNKEHIVTTGVAVLEAGQNKRKVFYDKTIVTFGNYSDKDIWDYIDTGEPMDKAGSYAIQGGFGKHVEKYEGSLENIIGFPWEKFFKEVLNTTDKTKNPLQNNI